MEGQGIESHILEDPPSHDSDISKTSEQYLSWKKDDSLHKSWIRGTLTEEVLYLVSGPSTAKEIGNHLKKLFSGY